MIDKVSVILTVFNGKNTIKKCILNIQDKNKGILKEIIVINDNSSDGTTEILKKIKKIKIINLKKNKGVGYARHHGAKIAKYNMLCYVDSDLIISTNSIKKLIARLKKNKITGSVGAIQKTMNLTKRNWSSNFVCLKSCYGFDNVKKEIKFSVIHSEFCVIEKSYLLKIGGWKSYRNAGGEEFELGDRITKSKKEIILIKSASYTTYYTDIYTRFKKIIDRTEKYIGILIKKKYFDTTGSFATKNQSLSAICTSLYLIILIFTPFLNIKFMINSISLIFITQVVLEYNFLMYAKKYFGFKMLFYSFYGIQIINLGILIGACNFFINKLLFKNK